MPKNSQEDIEESVRIIQALIEGKHLEAQNASLEALARKGYDPKTFLAAAKICSFIAGTAPHYTGYNQGATVCENGLTTIGNKLNKYLSEFGRP